MKHGQWLRPRPITPRRALSAQQIDDAFLSRFVSRDGFGREKVVTGAVYRGDELVGESVRQGGVGGDLAISENPSRIERGEVGRVLAGRWLYGGNWMNQFGHFILETLPTLWWEEGDLEGIVFHPFLFGSKVQAWQREFIGRLNPDVCIEIVDEDIVVERLVVPERAVVLNESVSKEAIDVWRSISSSRSAVTSPTFFSRSALVSDPRSFSNDGVLDQVFEELGVRVVHPERLSIQEQLQIAADSEVLIGISGSALHLSAFAPIQTPTIEIGDKRTRGRPVPAQEVLDASMGRFTAFVPAKEELTGLRDVSYVRETILSLLEGTYPNG